MAFQTRKHLSRQGNIAKRLTKSALADAIAKQTEKILHSHDPTIRKPALTAASHLAGAIAAEIAVQTQAVQRSFPADPDRLNALWRELVGRLVDQARGSADPPVPVQPPSMDSVEVPSGVTLPDAWAGPVAGPTSLERRYGMARSTVFRWMKRGEVVSLKTLGNRPVFPLEQFVDGRPADGIPEMISIFGGPRKAWQWLMTPRDDLTGKRPIDELIEGNRDLVIRLAARVAGAP
jgi:hypothetical protein